MNVIHADEVSVAIPSGWAGLHGKKIEKLLQMREIPRLKADLQLKALHILLGWPLSFSPGYWVLIQICKITWLRNLVKRLAPNVFLMYAYYFLLTPESQQEWLQTTDWVASPIIKLKNPVPRYGKLYGPDDELKRMTFIELARLDCYIRQHLAGDDSALNLLISVFWRPMLPLEERSKFSWNGDLRVPYIDDNHEQVDMAIRRMPIRTKKAIFQFLSTAYEQMIEAHPEPFKVTEDAKQPDPYSWFGLILRYAGEKFGNLEQTKAANAWEVMLVMDVAVYDHNKRKAELEEQKRKTR